MGEKGIKILKCVGLFIALLAFIFLVIACAVPAWTKCDDIGYANGLWSYTDESSDGEWRPLYEEMLQRVIIEDPRCTGKSRSTWYTNDNVCQSAYYCDANGQVTDTKTCAAHQQFDKSDDTCKDTDYTKTKLSGCKHPDCKDKASGHYVWDPATCKIGYRCNSAGSFTGNTTCSGSQVAVSGSCKNLQIPDSNKCKQYYHCDGTSETVQTKTCLAGQYFDGTNCVAATVSGNDASAPVGCYHDDCPTSDGAVRSGTPSSPSFTYNVNCQQSYYCKNSQRTKQTITDCTGSQQFNMASPPTCQVSIQTGCKDTACNGKADGYHITDSGTCQAYMKCTSGVKSDTGTCPGSQLALISADLTTKTCTNHNQDGSTCKKYLTCSLLTVTQNTCASGKYYNSATKACDAETVSGTTTTVTTGCKHEDCVGRADTFHYTLTSSTPYYDTTCNTAFQCSSNTHKTFPACTTAGQQYDLSTNPTACTATLQTGCKHTDCTGKSDGYYVTDGTSCKNYIKCVYSGAKDFSKSGTCPGGKVFVMSPDRQTGSCQKTTASGSTTCKDPRCDAKPNHKNHIDTGVNRLCQNYYTCVNNFYTAGTCSANQNYVLSSGSCSGTFPYTATDTNSVSFTCKDVRCYGQADGYYTFNAECTQYYQCASGYYSNTFSCPPGQLFEQTSKKCITFDVSGGTTHFSCKINGGLSGWQSWSACTNNKGNNFGFRARSRPCNMPTKRNGGNDCAAGSTTQSTVCWLCPTQAAMETARFFMIFSLAVAGLAMLFILNSFCSMSVYPTVLTALCSLGVFVFGLGCAVSYSNVHPEELDECFETDYAWSLTIVGAVFGLISVILWIVVTVMTRKANKMRTTSKVHVGDH